MAFQFKRYNGWAGLVNRRDARDIGNGLSKAQNISLDVGGKIRTIGGLTDFTKIDGVTALTQTAKLCPGSSLFTYGSDHWRGTDNIVDLCADNNATADQRTEVNATTGWTAPTATITSDTPANYGISSNGTTYVLKMVTSIGGYIWQDITTVVGQRYKIVSNIYVEVGTIRVSVKGTSIPINAWIGNLLSSSSWTESSGEFIADDTTTRLRIDAIVNATTCYADNVYVTKIPRSDLDTNWLALLDAPNVQIDLYNFNDDAFANGLLDFGTVSSYVATIDKINFPTTKTITDANAEFLNQGIQIGDVRVISGCSTQTANNLMFVVEHVSTGEIRARGNPFTVAADEDGTVTLTKYNPTAFHYVNEALRVSPIGAGIALRPKHYSFTDRVHFSDAGSSKREYSNWFLNDVGSIKPTDIEATTSNGDGAATDLTAGAGFEIGITRTADDGEWAEGTYILAMAFKYDDGQVSALFVPSTDEEFGTAILDGDSLTLTLRAKNDYDERISGGYIFCRLDESDEPWSLLADISISDGARATLEGTYNAWSESSTADVAYTANFKSLKLSLDSYESLAGIDPTTKVEVFTTDNTFWDTSVIGGNRCFIASVRYTDAGGNLQHFRDRIMYSQVNAYDTFPVTNIIDVVRGDAEDYVKLGIYGNDLLCFKSRTLYIIDISDPDPAGWQMKQDANKGKYPFRGIKHPGAYFETPHGPIWCNEFGVFLYDGNDIVELLGDKIERSKFPLAYQRYMEFDGSDDYVSKSNDASLNFGANTDFSLEIICKINSIPFDNMRLIEKGSVGGGGKHYLLAIRTAGTCVAYFDDDSAEISIEGGTAVNDGNYHHLVATADRDSATGLKIYVDGASDATAVDISGVGDIDDTAKPLTIGIRSHNESSNPFDGDIALVRIWNRVLSSSEVTDFNNGAPVAFADIGANQTNLVSAWTNSDFDTFTSSGADISQAISGGIADNCYSVISPTIGKKYRVFFTVTLAVGSIGDLRFRTSTDLGLTADGSVNISPTVGDNSIEFTGAANDDFCGFLDNIGSTPKIDFAITNFQLVQIGCVAEWAPKGIGDATWTDQSDNSLDGAVNGATAIFEDSWESFYTPFTIIGYDAKTNLVIAMRDCTGKWSSGQDYGDAWLIDLDTLVHTTGRRIFTKGIVYSNWETDWNQNLIIAEQTSSTSVTIKRWTDEPQSQAVGLIDIRTADFDFGNPATAAFFDAFITWYKSSAAQTTPVSYATNGNDLPTAWTKMTGNFSAIEKWAKLSLQSNANTADTIRFKLGNPTNAGTIELNDIGIRFEEQPEDID